MSYHHKHNSLDLIQSMNIDEKEIQTRKDWLNFTQADVDTLLMLNDTAKGYANQVIDSLYEHFMSFEESKNFFIDPEVLKRVKEAQKEYFLRLTEGHYDKHYVEERLNIGSVHAHIGLDVKWYLGAYNFYLRAVATNIFDTLQVEKAKPAFFSLMKLVFLDIGLAIDTYIFQREKTIRQQQEAIKELSTPILQLRDGLLILPLVGIIDTSRAQQITEQLLLSIRQKRAKVVVVDITGVPTVDTHVANHLLQAVDASRLMGASLIITGLSAEIAQTLVKIGVDLSKLNTVGDLQGGIDKADKILGYVVVKEQEPLPLSP